MRVLLDAQLLPSIAPWLAQRLQCEVDHLDGSPHAGAPDERIFSVHRLPGAVIFTKDQDFVELVSRLGPPPQIVWIRIGNSTNRVLRQAFESSLANVAALLAAGEAIVELG